MSQNCSPHDDEAGHDVLYDTIMVILAIRSDFESLSIILQKCNLTSISRGTLFNPLYSRNT